MTATNQSHESETQEATEQTDVTDVETTRAAVCDSCGIENAEAPDHRVEWLVDGHNDAVHDGREVAEVREVPK